MKYIILIFLAVSGFAAEKDILICTSAGASPAIKKAAAGLVEAIPLKVLQQCGAASANIIQAESAPLLERNQFSRAAYNTLVIVGLKGQDPLLEKCWGHQAAIDGKQLYRLGYGRMSGDIGYVECDWNPFLYSNATRTNKFTTLCIKISGTTEAGVLKAAEAFQNGLLNGIVAAGEVQRVEQSILDLDPMAEPPPSLPQQLGGEYYLAGWTQPDAVEYRAYLDLGGKEPVKLWRAKYLTDKVLDDVSGEAWVKGLHRLAYGNAVTIAEFASAADAAAVYGNIARQGGAESVTLGGIKFTAFKQPTDEAFKKSFGKIYYSASGKYLIVSSLSEKATSEIPGAVK